MAKPPIPIREVVRLSGKSRQAVYKAIKSGNLTEADLYGVKAVADNQKLADFIGEQSENGNKRAGR